MSLRLTSANNIIIIMLIQQVLHHIIFAEPSTSRRQALIQTVTNAEKQAKIDSRISFLVQCRRANVTPKFLRNCISTITLGSSEGIKKIRGHV